jgi:uncharacterized protein
MATVYDFYSDINVNYIIDRQSSDIKKEYDIEAIKNSIRNILTTRKMERRMLPEFGASLEQILFEPMDDVTAKRIGEVILNELKTWEPRISLTDVNVTSDIENLCYFVTINYEILSPSLGYDSVSFVLQG